MVLFSTVKRQKNLTVYLSTAMESCEMGEGSTIRSIDAYQLTTETHWKISGKVFIDWHRQCEPLDIMQGGIPDRQ